MISFAVLRARSCEAFGRLPERDTVSGVKSSIVASEIDFSGFRFNLIGKLVNQFLDAGVEPAGLCQAPILQHLPLYLDQQFERVFHSHSGDFNSPTSQRKAHGFMGSVATVSVTK